MLRRHWLLPRHWQKLEEAQDLVNEESKKPAEQQRLVEDKKKDYVEEEIPELIPVEDHTKIDESRNQAGPSMARPTAPRPPSHKTPLEDDGGEPEGTRAKVGVEKNVHGLEGGSPDEELYSTRNWLRARMTGSTMMMMEVRRF